MSMQDDLDRLGRIVHAAGKPWLIRYILHGREVARFVRSIEADKLVAKMEAEMRRRLKTGDRRGGEWSRNYTRSFVEPKKK